MIDEYNLHRTKRTHLAPAVLIIALLSLLITGCSAVQEATNAGSKGVSGADDAAAMRSLRTIASAESQYMMTAGDGSYGTFEQLVGGQFLDQRFKGSAPVVNGYVFNLKLTPKSGEQAPSYSVNADPQASAGPNSGGRHFYMDSNTSVIHVNANQAATASDPPLQ